MKISREQALRGLLLGIVYLTGILGIVASGGGGSGDSDSTGISYTGNTDPAVITRSNAARLVGNILVGQTIVESSSGGLAKTDVPIEASTHAIGLARFPGRLIQKLRNAMKSTPNNVSRLSEVRARTDLDETEPCDNIGGTIQITGFIEDDGTGTLTLDFINCREGDETLDGRIAAQINVFDFGFLLPTDAIYSFSVLTLTSSTFNVSLDGSIHSQISIGAQTEQLTVDRLVARNNATGEMIMITNQVSVIDADNIIFPSSFSETISGRIYDSTHGYVDFTTISAIIFSTITQEYPDGGQLLLTGGLNSGIRFIVISDTHTTLDLNLDGDATFEIAVTVSWSELETEPDFTDSDGDGMHDNWEQANGLNPLDPADADQDLDGDGFTNFQEYSAGTDLNDGSFFPKSADLSVDIYSLIAAFRVNDDFRYIVEVKNSGPDTSPYTSVNITLPAGTTLVSISHASAWNCTSQDLTVTCISDAYNFWAGAEDTFDMKVTAPAVTGDISASVSVEPQIIDLVLANNSKTIINPVGVSTAGIQSQIDAAIPGTTIFVDPGVYVGCLDFGGKDVNLQSTNGAQETILSAFDCGSIVSIGPNGSISGFTITDFTTRGLVGYGPGVQVTGAGSIISRNIFEKNNERISSSGGAIDGNTASPLVERNIFRNISCDSQFTSGTISFVNSSSPVIVNNIFANNPCRGINLTLPTGNSPVVINNTLVGNDVGIRIDRRVTQVSQIYRNNIIVGNGIGLEVEFGTDASNPVWENNLVFNNTINYEVISDQSFINGNISSDPLFIDATAGNYQLQIGSPAIDTGNSVDAPVIDFDGTVRPLDGNGDTLPEVDMGAFEAPVL